MKYISDGVDNDPNDRFESGWETHEPKTDAANQTASGVNGCKKRGFWFVVTKGEEASENTLVSEHTLQVESRKSIWIKYYHCLLEQLIIKIKYEYEKLRNYEAKIKELESEIPKKEQQFLAVKEQLSGIRIELLLLQDRVIKRKNEIAESAMVKLKDTFNNINSLQNIVVDNEIYLKQKLFPKNSNTNQIWKTHLDKLVAKYNLRFDRIHARIERMIDSGINDRSSIFLLSFGSICAGVAAWYFSVYTYNSGLGNQDFFYYLLQGFLTVGENDSLSFLQKSSLLAFYIISIGVIFSVFHFFIRLVSANKTHKEPKRNSSFRSRIKLGMSETSYVEIKNSSALFIGIVQSLPFLFVEIIFQFNVLTVTINTPSFNFYYP